MFLQQLSTCSTCSQFNTVQETSQSSDRTSGLNMLDVRLMGVSAPASLLHGDKRADVSFLGALVPSWSLGSSLSLCGWCRSVYGPPKTAQLNPQIETPTPHLPTALLKTLLGCVCVHVQCCIYMYVCECVCGVLHQYCWLTPAPLKVEVYSVLSVSLTFIRVMTLNKTRPNALSLKLEDNGLIAPVKVY